MAEQVPVGPRRPHCSMPGEPFHHGEKEKFWFAVLTKFPVFQKSWVSSFLKRPCTPFPRHHASSGPHQSSTMLHLCPQNTTWPAPGTRQTLQTSSVKEEHLDGSLRRSNRSPTCRERRRQSPDSNALPEQCFSIALHTRVTQESFNRADAWLLSPRRSDPTGMDCDPGIRILIQPHTQGSQGEMRNLGPHPRPTVSESAFYPEPWIRKSISLSGLCRTQHSKPSGENPRTPF